MKGGFRLRTLGLVLLLASFAAALAAGALWFSSVSAWQAHLSRSYIAGVSLYETLRRGTPPPEEIVIAQLGSEKAALAEQGAFFRLHGTATPGFTTHVSIIGSGPDRFSGEDLTLAVVSDTLRYPVSKLSADAAQTPAQKLGEVTRLLATYCSEPMLFARSGTRAWVQIDGTKIWGCSAAPPDRRLWAVFAALFALAVLATLVLDVASQFEGFARELGKRRRAGGPERYDLTGPKELRDIVLGVNGYLERERAALAKRATVLSGVSHDLGTPATRLRLRSALIKEQPLREKLEADIDSMREMIESVLTYAHAELNEETPREMSLTSLVDALVADYQDMGHPVSVLEAGQPSVLGGRSVFGARHGTGVVPDVQRIVVMARPIALKRAISNLIDNALKYGRRATIELQATAEEAIVVVEDAGGSHTAGEVDALVAPFTRGDNSQAIGGYGLGLTIVSTVAEQHGGDLAFEDGLHGLRACLKIAR